MLAIVVGSVDAFLILPLRGGNLPFRSANLAPALCLRFFVDEVEEEDDPQLTF